MVYNNSNQFNMFRAIILPIFRSTRLCVTACCIMHSRCCRQVTLWVLYTTSCNTQSSAPEDGQNYRPKYVELIGIINKPLLLHIVGYLYYSYCKLSFYLYPTVLEAMTNYFSRDMLPVWSTKHYSSYNKFFSLPLRKLTPYSV